MLHTYNKGDARVNLQQYLTPAYVSEAAGIAGGVVALALVGFAIWNRRSISKSITSLWQNTFSQGGLFYFGMALFMLASVVEAGPVLNKIAMHGALWGYGGHMLVFAFDMIASVSLRAFSRARRLTEAIMSKANTSRWPPYPQRRRCIAILLRTGPASTTEASLSNAMRR